MTAACDGVLRGRVDAAGTRFAALLAGPPPQQHRRGTVIFVNGLFGSKEDFEPLLTVPALRGYRLCSYDQRGQHETPGPDEAAAYTLQSLSSDLLAVTAAVGDGRPTHLVGHCAGGIIASQAVLSAPGAVTSLALLGCPLRVPRDAAADLVNAAEMIDRLGMRALEPIVSQWARAEPERRPLLETRMRTTRAAHLSGLARALAAGTGDLVAPLIRTGTPTLVVHGAGDGRTASREEFRQLAERFGRSAVRVPGARHNVQVDRPDATAAALTAFWAECGSAGHTPPAPA
ncbi:alpha/beta fold hydrolase [Planomonospora venezuelensis]|uniref:Pimeloyl-ACP methyl ester carboxylesterase n=1 Tax=Planomonospora venezuelensis TaxID=1999 RepID=A0A841D9Z2_PLAVE|nr:alpha/beta hydrolase [Planomonospora venezuelensis]MBB5964945.1 pimeloyl-ACP methyl ester carboxylesterase [Planomonospora venezuelensis]GIN03302.1 alpha/beta hydrolase [Planomonospora venezuelensis]